MDDKIVTDVDQKLQSYDFRKLIKFMSDVDKDAVDWLLNHAKINQKEGELSGFGTGEPLGEYLSGIFNWCESPQGDKFWREIAVENGMEVW